MAQNKDFTDKENVDVAMLEYKEGIKVGSGLTINDDKTYIGTVSQIHDNVHGNEAQFLSFQTSNNDCASISFRKIV